MALDLQTRDLIASDLAWITKVHALDVLQGRKSDAFGSLYQQACAVKRSAERRQRIIADDLDGMDGMSALDGLHTPSKSDNPELFMFIAEQVKE